MPARSRKAKAEGKTVLVNFTGYACTNCHWMKANMFTKPEIAGVMKNMVLVDLYTDGTDAASAGEPEAGRRQVPDRRDSVLRALRREPECARDFPGLTRKPEEYLAFLNTRPSAAHRAGGRRGSPVTPFKTLDGAALSTADWKGKVVVLNYWATWCVPCRSEIPEFNKHPR